MSTQEQETATKGAAVALFQSMGEGKKIAATLAEHVTAEQIAELLGGKVTREELKTKALEAIECAKGAVDTSSTESPEEPKVE